MSGSGTVVDYFTPQNYATLNRQDLDLCDGGTILFTSTNPAAQNLLLVAGKSGGVNVLNRASLGGISAGNLGALQSFIATTWGCGSGPGDGGCYEVHSPAMWNPATGQTYLYVWAQNDVLRVWDFQPATNTFKLDPIQGTVPAPGYPGAGLAISANGNTNGIVWGIVNVDTTAQSVLYAFDATNAAKPLWTSRDYWYSTKFSIPTVVNGKVYVPTSASTIPTSGAIPTPYTPALRVYGLCGLCVQPAQDTRSESPAAKP